VPLKGEARSKRAGRMPALQGRELRNDCDERGLVLLVSVFDVSFFFNSKTPTTSVS
jgi:hypothetical protein